jgi:DHA3 family macrolide efflux protein-like MFS transporter
MHGVEITKNLSHHLTISLRKTMAMQATANKETFRQYLLFFSGQQVSLLGSSIVQFVVVWWITVETGSPVYLSLAALAGFAPLVILSPFGGVLVDRFSRKRVILVADLCQTVATIVLILCFWLDLASIYVVLGIILLRGVFQAFHMPAVNAIIPSMVPQDRLSRINSLEYVFNGIV